MKKIICSLCNGTMEYKQINDTHMWSCEECPAVLFEYYSKQNIRELAEILER